MTEITLQKKILEIADKDFIADVDIELRSFNLYKQRIVNIFGAIQDTMTFIFNNDEDKDILLLYMATKYNFLVNSSEDPTEKELKEEKKEFYKTIKEIINYYKFDSLLNRYIKEKYIIDPPSTDGGRKSNDQLLLTREHCIDLQKTSFCMRFFSPLISDYFAYRQLNDNDYFDAYYAIMQQFNTHNISNKLYKFVSSRVENTTYSDAVIWAYLSSSGKDTKNTILDIFNKIIVLLLYKLSPDKYPVSFIHAGIKNQLEYKFRENISVKFSPILIHERDDEGVTSYDKFEIELLRLDEGKSILNEVNQKYMVKKLKEYYSIDISREEILEYQSLKLDKLKINLTFTFFTQYFGSFDNYHLSKLQFIELILLFKGILEYKQLPLLAKMITAEVINEKKKTAISNKDLLNKLRDTQRYNQLYKKYSVILSKLVGKKSELDPIMRMISNIYFNKWEGIDNSDTTKKKMIVELLRLLSE